MSRNINIPVVTDLVTAGDPKLKASSDFSNEPSSQFDDLNARIDALESAIGQDKSEPVGRAYAIRAEKNIQNPVASSSKNKEKL